MARHELIGIWLPFCNRRPGPPEKTGYPGIPKRTLDQIQGEAKHSAEGYRASMYGVLDNSSRQASWTFSIFKEGPPDQHYPLEAIVWTNGSPQANIKFIGEEHEGMAGEELNENQILWTTQITSSVRELCPAVKANPPATRVNLWEHGWLTVFGASPTACPSGRIPWDRIIAGLTSPEDDMPLTAQDLDAIRQVCKEAIDAYDLASAAQVEELETQVKELWERFVGWTVQADQLTPENHLGPADKAYVGLSTRDEMILRLRDIDHGI